MLDAFFYHLEGVTPEDVLPDLLQRGLARNMRMAVETLEHGRLAALSERLWSHEATSFIAHGMAGEPWPELQNIWLTNSLNDPNAPRYRFYFGGAWPGEAVDCERIFLLFNGDDDKERDAARQQWRILKSRGVAVKYWKKDESGRWVDMGQAAKHNDAVATE